MKDKVKMGLILTLCLLLCLFIEFWSTYVFDFIVLGLSLIAVIEFRKLQLKAGNPQIDYCPEVACFLIFVITFTSCLCKLGAGWILILVFATIILIYLIMYLGGFLFFKKEYENDEFRKISNMSVKQFSLFKANNTLACMVYPTIPMFFLYLINHISGIGLVTLENNTVGVPMGLFGLILLFAVCCLTDTFAMLFGLLIKGKVIFPKISPKKTIAGCCFGLLGGVVGALLTYLVFYLIFPSIMIIAPWWAVALVGLAGSVFAECGDFFESYCKRKAQVKDAGEIFRSHGGVIDRLDSIMFTAPFIFICLLFLFG